MWFFYFLPMLVAIGFLLARVSRGGSLKAGANWRYVALGIIAVVVLGVAGAVFAGMWR
jgi:hypothetical protein